MNIKTTLLRINLLVLLIGATAVSGCAVASSAAPPLQPVPSPQSVAAADRAALGAAALRFATPTVTGVPTLSPSLTPRPSATPTLTPSPSATATTTASPTASATASPAPPTVISDGGRQRLFNEVWQTIADNYLYEDFRGLDWVAVRAEFAPQVAAATSNQEFYDLLIRMVDHLDDHHSRFLAPGAAQAEDQLSTGREAQVGIGVLTMNTGAGAMIVQVFPNSPAADAGLQPRDQILAVDGLPLHAGGDIQGPEGSHLRLTVLRPGDDTRDVVLTRRLVEGRITPTVRRLEGDIGYLAVNTLWVHDMPDMVSGALTDLVVERPLRGIILDLRGNPGGWRSVLSGILSHFVQGRVGVFFDRWNEVPLQIAASSGPDLRDLPLVVLIDDGTASYAELLAGVLQAEAGALIIGRPSAGNTETIYAYELAGGARLWVAQEGFRLRDGTNLEGRGVEPDLLVDADWTRYSEADDPYILEALHWLEMRAGGE